MITRLKQLSPSTCDQIIPPLLKTNESIYLEDFTFNALRSVYRICKQHADVCQVTCSNQEWNEKFKALNQSKKPIQLVQEYKVEHKAELNTQDLIVKAKTLLKETDQLADLAFKSRDIACIKTVMAQYDQVIQTNISDLVVKALKRKARCFYQLSRMPDAIANYKRALALDPTNYPIIRNLAVAYAANKEYKKGMDLLRQKKGFFPEYQNATIAYCGVILASAGELEAAAREIATVTSKIIISFKDLSLYPLPYPIPTGFLTGGFQIKMPKEIYNCGAFMTACSVMAYVQHRLQNKEQEIMFIKLGGLFKEELIKRGGTVSDLMLTSKTVLEEKEPTVLFHQSEVQSVDDISLRQGRHFTLWKGKVSTPLAPVTELTPHGIEMLAQGVLRRYVNV